MQLKQLGQKIRNRSVKILIVSSQESERTAISTALTKAGHKEQLKVSDLRQAVGVLESENIDWLISPLFIEADVNLYNVLRLCTIFPDVQSLMISPLINAKQSEHIPLLAEFGTFYWFEASESPEQIKSQILELDATLAQNRDDPCRVAFDQFTRFLETRHLHKSIEKLCRSFIEAYPGDPQVLLALAKAQLEDGNKKDGGNTLHQLRLITSVHEEKISNLVDTFLDGNLPKLEQFSAALSPLAMNTAVSYGADPISKKVIQVFFDKVGVSVTNFAETEELTDFIANNKEPIELCIVDWNNRATPGATITQRLRSMGLHSLIFVVMYDSIDEYDEELMQEMGVSFWLPKPIGAADFTEHVITAIQQDKSPYEARITLKKLKEFLADDQTSEATRFKEKVQKNTDLPKSLKFVMEAELAFATGHYEAARDFALNALNFSGHGTEALNILGKALLKLGDFEASFEAFDSAQSLSPLNVQRICDMAEAKLESGDEQTSSELVKSALDIDEMHQGALEMKAKLQLTGANDPADVKDTLAKMSGIKDVISYLNNKAIVETRSGQFDKGVELYEQAREAIPEKHRNYRTVVNFNLGLAYLRANDMDKALEALTLCSVKENEGVANRASAIISSIHAAKAENRNVKMSETNSVESTPLNAKQFRRTVSRTIDRVKFRKGERFLFLSFQALGVDDRLRAKAERIPHFKSRYATKVGEKEVWV